MCFPENTNQNYFVLARKFFSSRAKTKKISRHVFRDVGWNNSRA
ncbi:DUF1661 domain-containing protein [Porphyromonas gingivalis]|nr:DUF1661 domain-containing protein [Porphyromonas gingivalis]